MEATLLKITETSEGYGLMQFQANPPPPPTSLPSIFFPFFLNTVST